jgi:hypothetical protein
MMAEVDQMPGGEEFGQDGEAEKKDDDQEHKAAF